MALQVAQSSSAAVAQMGPGGTEEKGGLLSGSWKLVQDTFNPTVSFGKRNSAETAAGTTSEGEAKRPTIQRNDSWIRYDSSGKSTLRQSSSRRLNKYNLLLKPVKSRKGHST